ncbi:hypothetical protein ACR4XW_08590 [Enemella sp. A6]
MDADRQPTIIAPGRIHDKRTAYVWLLPSRHRWPIVPPAPMTVYAPWGRRPVRIELDEERAFGEAIREVFRTVGASLTSYGTELDELGGVLVTDTRQPPVVLVNGFPVGRLPEHTVADYGSVLTRLARSGAGLAVPVRLWAREEDRIFARATIRLPAPEDVFPPAGVPNQPHVVLPGGRKYQVTGEEKHLETVVGLLDGQPSRSIAVTLHEQQSGSKAVVEVRCLGERVGQLTSGTSEQMLPVVRGLAERGQLAVCRARVEGNQLMANVVLDVARTSDLPAEWIQQYLGTGAP